MSKTDKQRTRQLEATADKVMEQIGYVRDNIFRGRVTHTMNALARTINLVCQINKHLKRDRDYALQFEKMLFQAQGGPLEVVIQNDTMYINGVVSVEALKEFFIVNEPPGFKALEIARPGK
jgi:hypothetical protein